MGGAWKSKIIFGHDAKPGEVPWTASLTVRDYMPGFIRCGAVVLDATHALTDAGCIRNAPPAQLYVVAGSIKGNISIPDPQRQIVKSIKATVHPDYNPSTSHASLAVIKMEPMTLNKNLKPANFPPKDHEIKQGDKFKISGFGLTSSLSEPDILQVGDSGFASASECENYWSIYPVP